MANFFGDPTPKGLELKFLAAEDELIVNNEVKLDKEWPFKLFSWIKFSKGPEIVCSCAGQQNLTRFSRNMQTALTAASPHFVN